MALELSDLVASAEQQVHDEQSKRDARWQNNIESDQPSPEVIMSGPLFPELNSALEYIKTWARRNSPWAIHFNSGSCNGCDIEILATLTPRYDLERFGVKLQGSPRHADILICTGPVTRQARERLLRTYEQMPEPKFVVAVGSCAISGGAFQGCYNVVGHIDEVVPVAAYIPGCPPRPEAIIDGVIKLLESLKVQQQPVPAPKPNVN
jgi:NADH-quinone oxidoreductase B subunit